MGQKEIIDSNIYEMGVDRYTPTLTILIGPPCSGKSTYVKNHMRPNTVRVNQDDIRKMIKGRKYKFSNFMENNVKNINIQTTHILLNSGCNVILDNTHCNPRSLQQIQKEFEDKADIVYLIFEIPLWKLKIRNIFRCIKKRIWIPVHVIENMYSKIDSVKLYLKSQGIVWGTIKN